MDNNSTTTSLESIRNSLVKNRFILQQIDNNNNSNSSNNNNSRSNFDQFNKVTARSIRSFSNRLPTPKLTRTTRLRSEDIKRRQQEYIRKMSNMDLINSRERTKRTRQRRIEQIDAFDDFKLLKNQEINEKQQKILDESFNSNGKNWTRNNFKEKNAENDNDYQQYLTHRHKDYSKTFVVKQKEEMPPSTVDKLALEIITDSTSLSSALSSPKDLKLNPSSSSDNENQSSSVYEIDENYSRSPIDDIKPVKNDLTKAQVVATGARRASKYSPKLDKIPENELNRKDGVHSASYMAIEIQSERSLFLNLNKVTKPVLKLSPVAKHTQIQQKTSELIKPEKQPSMPSLIYIKKDKCGYVTESNRRENCQRVKVSCGLSILNDISYFRNNFRADFSIVVNETTFELHSSVFLARSEWFQRLMCFQRSTKKEENDIIKFEKFEEKKEEQENEEKSLIDDLTDLTVKLLKLNKRTMDLRIDVNEKAFKEIVNYVYLGNMKANEETIIDVIRLSNLFELECLPSRLWENYLKKAISNFKQLTVLKLLYFSSRDSSLSEMQEVCCELLNSSQKVELDSMTWQTFTKKYPELTLKLIFTKL